MKENKAMNRLSQQEKRYAQALGTIPVLLFVILTKLMWKFKRQLSILIMIMWVGYGVNYLAPRVISPKAKAELDQPVSTATPTPSQMDMQASWIAKYAQKYARPEIGKSASLLGYQLACLAHKENGWHANSYCGDNGLACGMYQYHEATWEGFRKIMMSQGLVSNMSSRLSDEDAIETTAWALSQGRENNWGPILRGGCQ